MAVCRRTNYVIHCAASIRFDEAISVIMQTNYASTEQLLRLASDMPYLRCFTYMSTAYVNSNRPRHSAVREEIYPLPGTSDPLAVAQTLLDLPAPEADKLVTLLISTNPSFSYSPSPAQERKKGRKEGGRKERMNE
jgi:hypothetical protein